MSDFILNYEELEAIARYSNDLGKETLEYSEDLEKTIVNNIDNVTGDSSGYLIQAADSVRDKIIALRQKSEAFYHFSDEITNLLIVAERMDQEVADAIAGQGEYSLEHQKAGRLEEWWVKLLDLLTDANKTILLLCIASLAKLKMKFDSLKNTIKDWYEREYIKMLEVADKIKMLNDCIKMAQGVGIYLLNVTAARLLEYIGTNISGLNNGTKDDNVNLLDIIKIFYNPLMDINDFMVGAAVAIDNNVFGGLLEALGGTAEPFQLDKKAFNLGRTVTDFALMVAGTGAFIFGAVGGAGGAALSSTGVGAVAGVPLTAAGVATMSIGGGIALKSAQNLVSDGLNLMSGEGHGSSEGTGKVTKPSGLPDSNAKPKGNYAPNDTPGYIRQNESADLLSQNGYKVEMLDEVPGGNGYGVKQTSNPDLLIENKVYDSYAPKAETSTKTIVRELSGKTKNQTPNIVLNLDDYAGNVDELITVIKQKATPGGDLKRLEDLKIIKDGKIINIFTD